MRSSVSEALGPRESAVEDSVDAAPGLFSRGKDSAAGFVSAVPGMQSARTEASRAGTTARKLGARARSGGLASARKAIGSESIDSHRRAIDQNLTAADEADANHDFLTQSYQDGEFNVAEAAERGILKGTEQPAEGVSMIPVDAEGKVSYETATGEEATVDLNSRAQSIGENAQTLRNDASRSARRVKRIRAAQSAALVPGRAAISTGRAGQQVGRAGAQAGKASGIVFAGAMTQSPYAAYHIGTRGGKHLIGPGGEEQPVDSADEGDVDWSAHRAGSSSQSSTPPWEKESGGDTSETV